MGTLKHGVFSIGFHPLSRVQKFAKKNPRGTLRKLIKPFREACRTAHHVYMGAVRARARARALSTRTFWFSLMSLSKSERVAAIYVPIKMPSPMPKESLMH